MTDGPPAPHVVGLHPDDAARRCWERGLEIDVRDEGWASSWWGHGQPWRVTEQDPAPGRGVPTGRVVVQARLRGPAQR